MTKATTRRAFLGLLAGGAALAAGPLGALASGAEKKEEGPPVGPTEDLMREHGALNRILLIYDETGRRLADGRGADLRALAAAAALVKRFIEGYHEKLEEEHVFPALEKAGELQDLTKTLREQHEAGRRVTADILALAGKSDAASPALSKALAAFARMYRPHEAREDTVLFPAFRALYSEKEFDRLGDAFEARERKVLGKSGFDGVVAELAGIERALGIHDLSQFTPR